jgi:hypothetical protein
MAEHRPGQMDITDHEKTFDSFIRMVTRAVIIVALILVFLALANS